MMHLHKKGLAYRFIFIFDTFTKEEYKLED